MLCSSLQVCACKGRACSGRPVNLVGAVTAPTLGDFFHDNKELTQRQRVLIEQSVTLQLRTPKGTESGILTTDSPLNQNFQGCGQDGAVDRRVLNQNITRVSSYYGFLNHLFQSSDSVLASSH